MGISATSMNISTSKIYDAIPTPFVNKADVSRGIFSPSYSTNYSPSSTAYGTNANPIISQDYISSAAFLEQNLLNATKTTASSNMSNLTSTLESTNATDFDQTSLFTSQNNVFVTSNISQEAAPITQNQTVIKESTPLEAFSNIQTTSNVAQSSIPLGTTLLDRESAQNLAAVNANYNVQFSSQGTEALRTIQNNLSLTNFQNNISSRMDGMIPMAAATLSDFSSSTSSTSRNLNLFDSLTETFNRILNGGGSSGGGGYTGREKEEEVFAQQIEKNKRLYFLS